MLRSWKIDHLSFQNVSLLFRQMKGIPIEVGNNQKTVLSMSMKSKSFHGRVEKHQRMGGRKHRACNFRRTAASMMTGMGILQLLIGMAIYSGDVRKVARFLPEKAANFSADYAAC
jgi:hypothetical protein